MTVAPPTQLVMEVSAVCNLRCPQCWVGLRWTDRGTHFFPMDLFEKVCAEAEGFVRHVYLHLWGEPTLNKNLGAMIKRVKRFATIDLATHGLNLTEEMADALCECDTLSVSIDGTDQETYEKYRVGGQFEEAMRGLRLLVSKFKGKVNWTFVVFKDNEHQIHLAQMLADSIGANIGFKPPVFWNREAMNATMPSAEKYRRFTLVDGEWKLKSDRLKCREFWTTAYILPDGNMPTCCYDGAAKYIMGNVKESSLLDVWNGEKYSALRANHSAGRLNPMCVEYCNLPS